jgi:hypothetical protein
VAHLGYPISVRMSAAAALLLLGLLPAAQADAAATPLTLQPAPPPPPGARPRALGQPTYLYINFDGAVLRTGCGNDAHRNCSTLADLFAGYVGPYTGDVTQRLGILQAVTKDLAEFGVRVVTRRPPPDTDYAMVLYGDLGPQTFAGIAPYVDCGDLWPSDTSFASPYDSSNLGSTVILQEAAHTWGLEHVDAPFDNLHPFKTVSVQDFTDECHPIVANTDLETIGGACNQIHELFCDPGYQNSYRELLHLFGPSVPDLVAPSLEITSPEEGAAFVLPATFNLQAEIDDDLYPQIYTVTLTDHGQLLAERSDAVVDFQLKDPPPGDYDMVVRIADKSGNIAEDRVRFTVHPEGTQLLDPPEEDPQGCQLAAPSRRPAELAFVLLLLLRPRRRP